MCVCESSTCQPNFGIFRVFFSDFQISGCPSGGARGGAAPLRVPKGGCAKWVQVCVLMVYFVVMGPERVKGVLAEYRSVLVAENLPESTVETVVTAVQVDIADAFLQQQQCLDKEPGPLHAPGRSRHKGGRKAAR